MPPLTRFLQFPVTRVHHEHRFIRHARVLCISATHVLLCHLPPDGCWFYCDDPSRSDGAVDDGDTDVGCVRLQRLPDVEGTGRPESPGGHTLMRPPPESTKKFRLLDLEIVAMKSTTSFMLRFLGAKHDYFFKSPDCLRIVQILRHRFACAMATILVARGASQHANQRGLSSCSAADGSVVATPPTIQSTQQGTSPPPADGGPSFPKQHDFMRDLFAPSGPRTAMGGAATSDDSLHLASAQDGDEITFHMLSLLRVYNAGGFDGERDVERLVRDVRAFPTSDERCESSEAAGDGAAADTSTWRSDCDDRLTKFRESFVEVRQMLLEQITTRQRSFGAKLASKVTSKKLPKFDDLGLAELAVEDLLQGLVFRVGLNALSPGSASGKGVAAVSQHMDPASIMSPTRRRAATLGAPATAVADDDDPSSSDARRRSATIGAAHEGPDAGDSAFSSPLFKSPNPAASDVGHRPLSSAGSPPSRASWSSHHHGSDVVGILWRHVAATVSADQVRFDEHAARAMSQGRDKALSLFGVREDLRPVSTLELVYQHLAKVPGCGKPNDKANAISTACRSIIVAIRAHFIALNTILRTSVNRGGGLDDENDDHPVERSSLDREVASPPSSASPSSSVVGKFATAAGDLGDVSSLSELSDDGEGPELTADEMNALLASADGETEGGTVLANDSLILDGSTHGGDSLVLVPSSPATGGPAVAAAKGPMRKPPADDGGGGVDGLPAPLAAGAAADSPPEKRPRRAMSTTASPQRQDPVPPLKPLRGPELPSSTLTASPPRLQADHAATTTSAFSSPQRAAIPPLQSHVSPAPRGGRELSVGGGFKVPRADSFSTDDVLPLLIYVVASSGVPHLVVEREYVQRLSDIGGGEATERAYYFTLFASAVQYIIDMDPAFQLGTTGIS